MSDSSEVSPKPGPISSDGVVGGALAGGFISSMTGFGRSRREVGAVVLEVEARSVNSRFLEISLRLPSSFSSTERNLREIVARDVVRGKVDIALTRRRISRDFKKPRLQREMANSMIEDCLALFAERGVQVDGAILSGVVRDVLLKESVWLESCESESEYTASHEESEAAAACFGEALVNLVLSRREEGEKIKADINGRLALLATKHAHLAKIQAGASEKHRDRLLERITPLVRVAPVDEKRIIEEIAFVAQRTDITEELVRLKVHIEGTVRLIAMGGECGRRLEFMQQEMLREINTLGSKVQDADAQAIVVAAKGELEKIREQAQNIE